MYGAVRIRAVTTISLLYMHHRDKLALLHSAANRAPVASNSNARKLEGPSGSPTAVPNPICTSFTVSHLPAVRQTPLHAPARHRGCFCNARQQHSHTCAWGSWESFPGSKAAQRPWSYPNPYSSTGLCISQSQRAAAHARTRTQKQYTLSSLHYL